MDIKAIRRELAALVEAVDGVRKCYDYPPDAMPVAPVAVVDSPAALHMSMGAGKGSGASVELDVPVLLFVAKQVDRASSERMDELALDVWDVLNQGGTLESEASDFYCSGWQPFSADEMVAYEHLGARFEVTVMATA